MPGLSMVATEWDNAPEAEPAPARVAKHVREHDEAHVARNGAALIVRSFGRTHGLARVTAAGVCEEVVDEETTQFPHVGGVSIAPDGTWGLFAEEQGRRLQRIEVENGAVEDVARLESGCVASAILDDGHVALWLERGLVMATIDGAALRRVATIASPRGVFSSWRGRVFLCGGNDAPVTVVAWAHGVLATIGEIEGEGLRHVVERERAMVWNDDGLWELGGLDGAWAQFARWASTQAPAAGGVRASVSSESFALQTLITGGPSQWVDWHPLSGRAIGLREAREGKEVLAGMTNDLHPIQPKTIGAVMQWQLTGDGERALLVTDGAVYSLAWKGKKAARREIATTNGIAACWTAGGVATIAAPGKGKAAGALVLHEIDAKGAARERARIPIMVPRSSWDGDRVSLGSACGGRAVALSVPDYTIVLAIAGDGGVHGIGVLELGAFWQFRDRDGALHMGGGDGPVLRLDGLEAAVTAALAGAPLAKLERRGLPVIPLVEPPRYPGFVSLRARARRGPTSGSRR